MLPIWKLGVSANMACELAPRLKDDEVSYGCLGLFTKGEWRAFVEKLIGSSWPFYPLIKLLVGRLLLVSSEFAKLKLCTLLALSGSRCIEFRPWLEMWLGRPGLK
jgi:hypothetical protein